MNLPTMKIHWKKFSKTFAALVLNKFPPLKNVDTTMSERHRTFIYILLSDMLNENYFGDVECGRVDEAAL